MNTLVSFELAKLLKEKGFDEYCKLCVEEGDERPLPFNAGNTLHKNSLHPYYSAPTIAEVIMWLYERHGIWITVCVVGPDGFGYWLHDKNRNRLNPEDQGGYWHSPTEAYEEAIIYTLENFI